MNPTNKELSFARRFWNAFKPPPAVRRWRPTPAQKRMLISASSVLTVIGVAGGAWAYIASAPQRAQAEFDQGVRRMTPGSYRDAVRYFDRAVQILPQFPQAFYQRGIAHHMLGETDAAVADVTQAIGENPSFGAAYTERGTLMRERGDLDRALQDFSRAVEAEPSANGFYQRGQTYASLGQPEKAIADFDRAIDELRDAPAIYRARAEAKRSLGDMAGYKADHDAAVQNEYQESPPAWVDQPLPADTPDAASAEANAADGIGESAYPAKKPAGNGQRKPVRPDKK